MLVWPDVQVHSAFYIFGNIIIVWGLCQPALVISVTFNRDNLARLYVCAYSGGCLFYLTLFVVSYNELGRLPITENPLLPPVVVTWLVRHLLLLQLAAVHHK